MVENLKTTKYNDGTAIPLVTDPLDCQGLLTPGYCWYVNDEAEYKATYGALYNWYVVDSASNGGKNVCPTGWHVPSDVGWTTLTKYSGGEYIASGKLKETGTTHWFAPNTDANNASSFTALPGGTRNGIGEFVNVHISGYRWSSTKSTKYSVQCAYYRDMDYSVSSVTISCRDKKDGSSDRCLRD